MISDMFYQDTEINVRALKAFCDDEATKVLKQREKRLEKLNDGLRGTMSWFWERMIFLNGSKWLNQWGAETSEHFVNWCEQLSSYDDETVIKACKYILKNKLDIDCERLSKICDYLQCR